MGAQDGLLVPSFPGANLGGVDPEVQARKARVFQIKASFDAYKKGLLKEADLRGLEEVEDEDLKQIALENAIRVRPDADDQAVLKSAKFWYDEIYDLRERRKRELGKVVDAAKMGAPTELLKKPEMQGVVPPSKVEPPAETPWYHWPKAAGTNLLSLISSGGRTVQGGAAGKVAGYETQRTAPITSEEAQRALTSQEGATLPVNVWATSMLNDDFGMRPSEESIKAAVAAPKSVAPNFNASTRTAGVPNSEARENVGLGLQTAGKALVTNEFSDEKPNLATELDKVSDYYKREALRLTIEKLGPQATDEEVVKEAEKLFTALRRQDQYGFQLENPLLTQFGYEVAGDAVAGNLFTRPLVWAGKGIKAAAKASGASEKLFEATKLMRRNPGAAEAAHVGQQDMADLMHRAQDAGEVAGEIEARRYAQIQELLAKVPKKMRGLFDEALDSTRDKDGIAEYLVREDPKLKDIFEQIQAITSEQYKLGTEELGKLQRFGTQEGEALVQAAPKVERYTPHKIFKEGVDDEIEQASRAAGFRDAAEARAVLNSTLGADKTAGSLDSLPDRIKNLLKASDDSPVTPNRFDRMSGTTGAEQSRTGIDLPWEPRAEKQFEAARKVETQATARAKEIKELEASGLLVRLPKGANSFEELRKLKGTSKVDFVVPPPQIAEQLTRLTAKAGTKVDDLGEIAVPKPVYTRLEQLFPLAHKQKNSLTQMAEIIKGINEYTVRPFQDIWRSTHTMLSGVPLVSQYWLTNAEGAVGLGVVGQGIKAANPRLQYNAARTALLATGLGDPAAAKTLLNTPDGAVELGKLMQMGVEDGALGQASIKYARDLGRSKSPVVRGLQKVVDKSRLSAAAEFIDNYQHAVNYVAAIQKFGTSKLGRAKALKFVEETSGLYRRMTPFEKSVVREFVPFYAWKRAIYPIVTKALLENPQRLQVFERLKQHAERVYGGQAPWGHDAVRDWMELPAGVTAPPSAQPESLEPDVKARTKMADGAFVMMKPETPLNMLSDLSPDALTTQLGPLPYALATMLMGYDIATGEKLPDSMDVFPDLGAAFGARNPVDETVYEMKNSLAGRAMYSLVEGPSETVRGLIKLYWDSGQHGMALDLAFRVGMRRKGIFGRETLGVPGFGSYVMDPQRERADGYKSAQEILQSYSKLKPE